MLIRFWGTRGSLPKPGSSTVRYGGNTSCVEVRSDAGTLVVIDCGSGAHDLGQALIKESDQPVRGHLLISHTHWDHIQGVPFFAPFFVPSNEWDIYAPRGLGQSIRDTLAGQMQYTYFPVTIEALGAKIEYHDLVEGMFEVGDITVRSVYLNHPALTLGYRLEVDGVSVVYSCDHEPHSRQSAGDTIELGEQDQRHVEFLRGADLVIHDAQYTAAEYTDKIGWGHSTAEYAVDVCRLAGVKRLALTHHDPTRDDDAIDRIVNSLRAGLRSAESLLQIFGAAEGETIELESRTDIPATTGAPEFSAVTPMTPAISEHSILLGATDAQTAELITSAAATENLRLTLSASAQSALHVIETDWPSLIIVDEQSAPDDALAICRRVKALNAGDRPPVPVVVVSDRQDSESDLAECATDWLLRPFSQEYVRTRIHAWIMQTTCRWIRAAIPENEQARLAALDGLGILDTEPEDRFDRITRIASAAFDVPVALVSLIDRDRQWFKSRAGLEVQETPRDLAFCAHAILEDELLIVPDALLDPRFADNPVVSGEMHVRFYAGCPLKAPDGSLVGTLCLVDTRPHQLDEGKTKLLRDLGKLVEAELSSGVHSE